MQSGADAVYFGSNLFNARSSAKNFDETTLKKAIDYAKLRNVKTHLTLNTLIKNSEFEQAALLANKAYCYGIDAIIVQDLGLASYLIKHFPDLPIHASTQMSIYNLDGVKKAEDLGFSRVVLARELCVEEIKSICKNSSIEIEAFIHGALCMSYSGQCLFSSIIGGRSGNRGKCAQGCRLPYELLQDNKLIDKGYLLSTKDVCSLELLPDLISAGVDCFKIEGRMKSPEYVSTVTKVYRKYIDMIMNYKDYSVANNDTKDLLQVFNRGGFSLGHLSNEPNKELVFPEKPNHRGIYLGEVCHFNANKGYIKLLLKDTISKLDTISVGNESGSYTVSELMLDKKNVSVGNSNEYITIGRVKGNIRVGDKVYKMTSKNLNSLTQITYSGKEFKKIPINAQVTVVENKPIVLNLAANTGIYENISFTISTNVIPESATSQPISKERIVEQLSKTGNTQFEFANIDITLGENLYIPKFSIFNELRRQAMEQLEQVAKSNYEKDLRKLKFTTFDSNNTPSHQISILLNQLFCDIDYTKLDKVAKVYIPLKYFIDDNFKVIIKNLCENQNVYIYLPTITRKNYATILHSKLDNIVKSFSLKGFVISNLSQVEIVKKYSLELIGNYTLNVFNNYTINELKDLGLQAYTISPELDKTTINELNNNISSEIICYGYLPLMNCNYCFIGKSNKCYDKCSQYCKNKTYYLKDRLGFLFKIVPDSIETVTAIYNSKIISIAPKDLNCNFVRLDFQNETIFKMNEIISTFESGNRIEGQDYTNGNFNKEV